ncbi:MAG: hypothetical protein HW421_2044 [Ignavibacteria bacterium]|nr:hypothetical protein [Ignavibacteria bacterium]
MTEETKRIKANPIVLKWARECLMINETRATELLKMSFDYLNQLETGTINPTIEDLKSMSKAYKRTIANLLLDSTPIEKSLPKDCRTIESSKIGFFNEKTIMAVRKARALTSSLLELNQELNISIPSFIWKASVKDDPKKLGIFFRDLLGLSEILTKENHNQFLDTCIDKLEKKGIAIFQLSLTQDGLRGFSLIDESIPVIIIKRGSELPSAKIFTLFHELGHILLSDGALCNIALIQNESMIEQWCNMFAAELLVPTTLLLSHDIIAQNENKNVWNRKELFELANLFHVSPIVILRRLLTLGRTTPEFYKEQHEKYNKPQFGRSKEPEGRNLPKEVLKERGRNYLSLVFKAYDSNKIDLKDMADYLGLKLSYIPKTRELFNAWT